jgi:hypothetical protein
MPAVASLVPWAVFLGTVATGDVWTRGSAANRLDDVADAAAFCLAAVALPSSVALLVARRSARVIVLGMLTAVAVVAGHLVVTSDGAQAGRYVLLIPAVALALAVLTGVGRVALAAVRHARDASGAPLLEQVPVSAADRAGLFQPDQTPPDDTYWSAEHQILPVDDGPRPRINRQAARYAEQSWPAAAGANGNGQGTGPPQPAAEVAAPAPASATDGAARPPLPPIPQPRRPFSVPPPRPRP